MLIPFTFFQGPQSQPVAGVRFPPFGYISFRWRIKYKVGHLGWKNEFGCGKVDISFYHYTSNSNLGGFDRTFEKG